MFAQARGDHQELCIPICVLPVNISNNIPGTELSVGCDTALNSVVEVRTSPCVCLAMCFSCPRSTARRMNLGGLFLLCRGKLNKET